MFCFRFLRVFLLKKNRPQKCHKLIIEPKKLHEEKGHSNLLPVVLSAEFLAFHDPPLFPKSAAQRPRSSAWPTAQSPLPFAPHPRCIWVRKIKTPNGGEHFGLFWAKCFSLYQEWDGSKVPCFLFMECRSHQLR